MSWRDKLSQVFGCGTQASAWPGSMNDEVVKTWNNPEGLSIPTEWKKLGSGLRASAKARKMVGRLLDRNVTDFEYRQLPGSAQGIGAAACIEKSDDDLVLKHAIIRWPGKNSFTTEERKLFQMVSLLVEPEFPSFMAVKKEEDGIYGHLVWPCDWNQAGWICSKELDFLMLPIFYNPIVIQGVRTEDQKALTPDLFQTEVSYNTRDYKSRAQAALGDAWFEMLKANLFLIGYAATYLNQQTTRDLFMLSSLKPDPKKQMPGKVLQYMEEKSGVVVTLDEEFIFGSRDLASRIEDLLLDRFSACPSCSYVSCPMPAANVQNAAELTKQAMKKTDPCCKFTAALIYPINRTWCIGSFEYQCPKCKTAFRLHRGFTLQDPAPCLPERIPGPLVRFLEDLTKRRFAK